MTGASGTARSRWIATAGSFLVYAFPLLTPHALVLLGQALILGLFASPDRNFWWFAANLAAAVTAQLALAAVIAWALHGSRIRLLAPLAAIPLLTVALNAVYLLALPAFFLTERDTAPEIGGWTEHCHLPDTFLLPATQTTVNRSPPGVSVWWVHRPGGRYALLRLPECTLADAPVPIPVVHTGGRVDFMLGLLSFAPGGVALFERTATATGHRTWLLLKDPGSPPQPIEVPNPRAASLIVSDGGDAIAWLDLVTNPGHIVVQSLEVPRQFDDVIVDLSPFGPASYALRAVDTTAREAVLWRDSAPLVLAFDGTRREFPFAADAMAAQSTTFVRHRNGWLAWDAYRDSGRYEIAWALGGTKGTRHTNIGRGITAAAVDPAGQLIAVSETTTTRVGSSGDVVYVFDTTKGADVFRRRLPRYSRSSVVFFARGLFGYSDLSGTRILRTGVSFSVRARK